MNFESWKTRALSVFFLMGMLGLALPFTLRHTARLIQAVSSLHWPQVEAEVVSTSIRTQGIPGKAKRIYETAVTFRYAVGRTFYESSRFSFDPVFLNTYTKTLDLAALYPKGQKVRAFYNPKNPGEAVLTPGVHWSHYLFFAVGAFFTSLSLFFGYLMLKTGRH